MTRIPYPVNWSAYAMVPSWTTRTGWPSAREISIPLRAIVVPNRLFVWRFRKNLPYVPAPLVYDGRFYMVKNGGIITALDVATGQTLKEGRSPGAPGEYFASPVAADGKVYLASAGGRISVLKAGGQWDVLGVNDLGDEIHATPALSGGRIFVRTRGALYCFGTV